MKNQANHILAIFSLGLASAIKNNVVSSESAEKLLFTPRTMKIIADKLKDDELVEIIRKGTELEDIENLFPDTKKLENYKNELIDLCLNYLSKENTNNLEDRVDWYDCIITTLQNKD